MDGTGAVGGDGRVIPLEEIEEGRGDKEVVSGEETTFARSSSPNRSSTTKSKAGILEGMRNFCSLLLGPVFVQSFVLTFLGEWGDRSQIATIALGAAQVRQYILFSISQIIKLI